MSKLAARQFDQHACPGHGLNAITTAARKTTIEGKLAARVDDLCACGATIAVGSSKVTIEGKAAARLTDLTKHGGSIISSASKVFIAD